MTRSFTKMHGLGNDFIVIDATQQPLSLSASDLIQLSRRDTGIGFDQCLIVENSAEPDIDFFYRIFNADGQEVGQCGNGARCLARFVQHKGLSTKTKLRIKTATTTMSLALHDDHTVTVDFGMPRLAPADIPLSTILEAPYYTLALSHRTLSFHAISVGNPHAVILVDDVDHAAVEAIGTELSVHPFFPQHVNVGFLQIVTPKHIKLRVYERGCGETRACGSGAVAAARIGQLFHHLADNVTVSLPGGDLNVTWHPNTQSLALRGPASFVYEGQLLEND